MNWLARLKKIEMASQVEATEPTKPGEVALEGSFVGFVAPCMAPMPKTMVVSAAANDSALDPDRQCWPHSGAMTGGEIDAFTARLTRFTDKGLTLADGVVLADKLVTRDRDADDRRLCMECKHLAGFGPWRCLQWRSAGFGQPGISPDIVRQLQRCDGFKEQSQGTA